MEVSIYMCLCRCKCVFMKGIFTCKRRLKCSSVFWSFPMNTTSRTLRVNGVFVCKSFRGLVLFNTVYSVSRLCSSSCSWQSVWSVSWYRSGSVHWVPAVKDPSRNEDQWLDSERPQGGFDSSVRSKVGRSPVMIWFQQFAVSFWCLFSRWLGLRRCWRSCPWWVRRCPPGSRGLHCRRSGVCGSSARTPPRSPPGTCGWPSARRSRRCETTGRGRAVTETDVFYSKCTCLYCGSNTCFFSTLLHNSPAVYGAPRLTNVVKLRKI